MNNYKDYIKTETDENGIEWFWIEEPLFTFDYFEKSINERYNARLIHRTKNDNKKFIEFIKEEIIECNNHFSQKPTYDFLVLSFAEKKSGNCWFSDETITEFQRYFLDYSNYKYSSFMVEFLGNKLKEFQEPKQNIKPKKELKDFFINNTKIEIIEKIQKEFKDYNGKRMAFIIYLLESEFKIITYSLNGKIDSRKHFVEALQNKTASMQGINKYFTPNDVNLNIHKFQNDNDFINIKELLLRTIN